MPRTYRVNKPIAQPTASENPIPASAIPELKTVTEMSDTKTTLESTFHGLRPMSRATVMNARMPPRMGAVEPFELLVEPAMAIKSRVLSKLPITIEAMDSVVTERNMATSASKSWRKRRRKIRLIEPAMGRPREPIPPITLRIRTISDGRSATPLSISVSNPAVVLVAK